VSENVFVGEFDRSIDGAGRVALPVAFREILQERCYATRDPQGCITLRSPAKYAAEAKRLKKLEKRGENRGGVSRSLSFRTVNLSIDKQGRVTLDETARTYAAIDAGDEATVVGNTDTIEIWRPARWVVVRGEDKGLEPDRAWPAEVDAT
jgi:division/cell wall cluster transcriptional repressor MraZ